MELYMDFEYFIVDVEGGQERNAEESVDCIVQLRIFMLVSTLHSAVQTYFGDCFEGLET